MIESIWMFIVGFQFNSTIAISLFWVPTIICVVGYIIQCIKDYKNDFVNHTSQYYVPTLTVGKILGRMAASFLPVINIFLALSQFFGIIADIFEAAWRGIEWLGKKLNIPLVPARPKPKTPDNTVNQV